jgi:type II secretory pathway component PulF
LKKNPPRNKQRLSTLFVGDEKNYFAENLSMLLSAGISVSSAVTIMSDGARNKAYKKILLEISRDLDEGTELWKALDNRGVLSGSYLYMVKFGESSGRLNENLAIIAEQQKKNKSFNSKLASALIYPVIILALTLTIGVGVTIFVIPNLARVFSGLHIVLPLPTRIMINLGNFISSNPILFFSFITIFIAVIVFVFFVPGTKRIGQVILFRIPSIRDLYKEIEIARFGYVMYSLVQAGIPLTEALLSVEQSTNLTPYRKFYHYLYQSVDDGDSLEKSFIRYKKLRKLLPINIQQMIIAGEHSGNFVSIIGKVSAIYEEKIDTTSKNLSVILEPILLVVVALGVLFLALSVIMPIYSLVGGLNA